MGCWTCAFIMGAMFGRPLDVPTVNGRHPPRLQSESLGAQQTQTADGFSGGYDSAATRGTCPGAGSCCEANHSPGCDDQPCCETVCVTDPYCCDGEWDEVCADEAFDLCDGGVYCMFCPGEGSCCEAHGTPGCDDIACCQAVCTEDRYCCTDDWDPACVGEADQLCGGPGESFCGFCPGAGDCCEANNSPGCDQADCCLTVCAEDPFCCGDVWDDTCADIANSLCGGGGGYCGACPGTGACCELNGTAGCDEVVCCEAVCATNPSCCFGQWGATCAGVAQAQCGICSAPPIPTVSEWGLITTMLLLLAVGTIIFGRRPPRSTRTR